MYSPPVPCVKDCRPSATEQWWVTWGQVFHVEQRRWSREDSRRLPPGVCSTWNIGGVFHVEHVSAKSKA